MPEPTFVEDGGLVWVNVGSAWPGFTEALNDGVSALSPSGEPPALSTSWIDAALEALGGEVGAVIASGNTSTIIRTAEGVSAESDHELFDAESMSVEDLRTILMAWRERVVALLDAGDASRPAQAPYQRNPRP